MSALQVLSMLVVNPIGTPTMLSRSIEDRRWPTRVWRDLEDLGPHVPRAFVGAEDQRFFLHGGFDWDAVCKAADHNKQGRRIRGASTITQQVAKNLFLWQGRSWARKGLEVWYTLLLELFVPKHRILELYLNVAETGPGTFGAEAGAQRAYGRPAARLSADEAGRLAGILPNPVERSVTSAVAVEKAAFVAAHPAPFPVDPGYALVLEQMRRTSPSAWRCLAAAWRQPK